MHADDEREFSYEIDSETGPEHWGEMRPEWKDCNSGIMQSPIDLLNQRVEVVPNLGTFQRAYKPSNAILLNRGHDMMLKWSSGAGNIEINGTLYQLKQCHWHSPSEHTVNSKRLDMEVHLVHQADDNRTAVIGILYKIGQPDPFLSMIQRDLEDIEETRDIEKELGIINPETIKPGGTKYYRYTGSLTTPPCTENIIWTILGETRTVSKEQVELIRDAIHDDAEANARPVQPIHDRMVKLNGPTEN
ncbi:alpha carbonic anhydrase 7 [Perilla frutescens var. hirtella]|nr:alpha carbonic anhydrase 7 [Perilla frutescens var. hirtella]